MFFFMHLKMSLLIFFCFKLTFFNLIIFCNILDQEFYYLFIKPEFPNLFEERLNNILGYNF